MKITIEEGDVKLIHYGENYFAAVPCTINSFTAIQEEIVVACNTMMNVFAKIGELRQKCYCHDHDQCKYCVERKDYEGLLK